MNQTERSLAAIESIAKWRKAHPKATLAEIEQAIDAEMSQVRAQMLEEVAQAGEGIQEEKNEKQQACPQCGTRMHRRGKRARKLQTQGGAEVTFRRWYMSCPDCGYGFFPPGRGTASS